MRGVRGFVPPEPEEERAPVAAAREPAAPPAPPAATQPAAQERPVRYMSTGQLASKLQTRNPKRAAKEMSAGALGNLLRRYKDDPKYTSPVEDSVTESDGKTVLGWLPGREAEVAAWLASLPDTGTSPRSGRWRDEAGAAPEGGQWVSLTGSRGKSDHLIGAEGETLCGIKPKGTGEPKGQRCTTCAQVAARNAG